MLLSSLEHYIAYMRAVDPHIPALDSLSLLHSMNPQMVHDGTRVISVDRPGCFESLMHAVANRLPISTYQGSTWVWISEFWRPPSPSWEAEPTVYSMVKIREAQRSGKNEFLYVKMGEKEVLGFRPLDAKCACLEQSAPTYAGSSSTKRIYQRAVAWHSLQYLR